MKLEKNVMLSLRIEENLMNKIEICAIFNNVNKSDFIRKALFDSTKYTEFFPVDVPAEAINFLIKTLEPLKNIRVLRNENTKNDTPSEKKIKQKMENLNIAVQIFQNTQTMNFSGEIIQYILEELTEAQIQKVALKTCRSEIIQLQKSLLNDEIIMEYISEELMKDKKLLYFIYFCLRYIVNEVLSEKGRKWFDKCQITRSNDVITFVGKHHGGIKYSHFFMTYFEYFLSIFPFQKQEEPILNEESIKLTYKLLIDPNEVLNIPQLIKKMNSIVETPIR